MVADIGNVPAFYAGGSYGNGCDGGFGGNGIWAILLLALLGNRRGFGGFGDEGGCCERECHDRCCEKELDLINTNMDSRFNQITQTIDHNTDLAFQQGLMKEMCDTNVNIDRNAANLAGEIGRLGFQNAIAAKDNTIELLECCA